jgi:hypothetical protein
MNKLFWKCSTKNKVIIVNITNKLLRNIIKTSTITLKFQRIYPRTWSNEYLCADSSALNFHKKIQKPKGWCAFSTIMDDIQVVIDSPKINPLTQRQLLIFHWFKVFKSIVLVVFFKYCFIWNCIKIIFFIF